MSDFILIFGLIVGFLVFALVFLFFIGRSQYLLGWLFSIIAFILVAGFSSEVSNKFKPPKTAKELEEGRYNSIQRSKKQIEWYLTKANEAGAKGDFDTALIWTRKASDEQYKIDQQ